MDDYSQNQHKESIIKLKMVKKLSFSSVEKLKDFVDKRGRLPDDISKKTVCKDIVQLLESNVSALQKNQV